MKESTKYTCSPCNEIIEYEIEATCPYCKKKNVFVDDNENTNKVEHECEKCEKTFYVHLDKDLA